MDIMDLVRKKRQAIQASSGRREKTHKPQPGKSRFRILPGWKEGDVTFFRDFGSHFIKDTNDDLKAVYICTEKTNQQACPICEGIAAGISASSDDAVIAALKESQSSNRILFNALHLDGDDPNSPVILDLTPTTAEKIFDLMGDYGNVTDLDEGTDILINRTGKGLNTEYSIIPAPKSNTVDKAVLANLHDLDAYVQQEYDEGKNKAIAAVSTVSGLLPHSSGPAISHSGGAAAAAIAHDAPTEYDEDEYGSIPETPVAEALAEPKAVKAEEEQTDDLSDSELEDMLGMFETDD